jgi:hypothetical protein
MSRILKKETTAKNLLNASAKAKLLNFIRRIEEIKEIRMNRKSLAYKFESVPLNKRNIKKNDLSVQSIIVNMPRAYKELVETKTNHTVASSEYVHNENTANHNKIERKLKKNMTIKTKVNIIPKNINPTIKEDKEIKRIEEEMFHLKFLREKSLHKDGTSIKPYKEITNNDVFKKIFSKVAIVNLLDYDNKYTKILRTNKSQLEMNSVCNDSYIMRTEESEKKGEKLKSNFKPPRIKKSALKINKNSIFLLTNN